MTRAVTMQALRAHAVRRSLFAPTDLTAAIDALGFVQLDPIRAPARAADLILRQRVAGYRAGDLDRAYPNLPLAEDFIHVYGVLPLHTQALLHPRAAGSWQVERAHPRLAAKVVAHIRANGVTHPRDLHGVLGKQTIVNGWGGTSAATTRMLEALQYRGTLHVARRESGIKLYDLAATRSGSRPHTASARATKVLYLLLRLYAPLPEGSLRRLARMIAGLGIAPDVAAAALERFMSSKAIRRVRVDETSFVMPADEVVDCDVDERVRLLTPFDPVVWDRPRFERFWGWDYRFEAYTPPAKRRFGYYALPMLWRDDVIGWANATQVEGKLEVTVGFARPRPRGAPFRHALEAEVASLATTVGATHFAIAVA